MPTKFCASDGPAVPSSILCSCWTSRVRTPVAVSHTSCTHTAWIEWIEIKNAANAATEMGGGLQDVWWVHDDANVMHFPVGCWGKILADQSSLIFYSKFWPVYRPTLTTSSVVKLEIGRGIFAPEVPIISNQLKMWLGLGRFVLKDPFFCKCLVLSNHPPKANLRLPCCMERFYDAFYKARCRCWMLPG